LCHNLKTTLTVGRIVSNFCVVAIIYNYRSTFKIQSNRPANSWLSSGLFRVFVAVDLCPLLQQRFLVSYICGFEFHLTCTKKSTGGRHIKRSAFVCGWYVMVSDSTFSICTILLLTFLYKLNHTKEVYKVSTESTAQAPHGSVGTETYKILKGFVGILRLISNCPRIEGM
jgi:hypothetical protein